VQRLGLDNTRQREQLPAIVAKLLGTLVPCRIPSGKTRLDKASQDLFRRRKGIEVKCLRQQPPFDRRSGDLVLAAQG
jgi:hypothetical protein